MFGEINIPLIINKYCVSFTVGPIGPQANILQEAQIDVMKQADCINAWGANINNGHVCVTDVANKAKGACVVSISMLFCDIDFMS